MKKIVEHFVKYPILSNVVIAITIIIGGASLLTTKKSFFPETSARDVRIQVTLPGASPQEMEEGVTQKIEESIRNIAGIDEITSTSSENFTSIRVTTLKGYDLDELYTEIKNAVDRLNSLPGNAERPVIFKGKNRSMVQWIALRGDVDLKTLKRTVENIRDDLLVSGKVSQATAVGYPELEIAIEVSEDNLSRYGVTFDQVVLAVKNNNKDVSAGAIKTNNEEILIRSRAKQTDAERIGEIIIRANSDGSNLFVKDIATITEQFAEVASYSTMDGKPAVWLRVEKLDDEDIQEIATFTKEYVDKFNASNENLQMVIGFDFYDMLKQRLNMLINNGVMGLLLVIVCLGLFLSVRLSFWVAWGIPSSFLGMFILAQFVGMTINMISLFGMILVIGILVDDGIVIAENIYSHFEKGKNPYRAAVDGTMEVLPAVTTSVTTTIVAFTPILLLVGTMEFLFDMALVVIFSLGFSLLEAFLVLPAHLASPHVLRSKKKTNIVRIKLNQAIDFLRHDIYGNMLKFTMSHKWLSMAFLVSLFPIVFGLLGGGFIKATFFPNIPFFNINVDLVFKAGTREHRVETALKDIENKVWELNEELKEEFKDSVDYVTHTFTSTGGAAGESGSHAGNLTMFHRELESEDPINSFELTERLRKKIGEIPDAEKLIVGGGGRFGKPVAIRLMGKDYESLTNAKEFLKGELRQIQALKEVQDNTTVGRRELLLDLTSQAYFLGLSHNDITKQIRQGFFGEEAQRLQKGADEVKVWVRYPKSGRKSIGQLDNLKIKQQGKEYTLAELANYKVERGIASIKHYETSRTITVDAEMIDPYGEVPPIMDKIKADIIPVLNEKFPNVKVEYGGQAQNSAEASNEIGLYFSGAFFVMFILLILNFKSFYQAVIVMAMIPIGWLGSILGHGIQSWIFPLEYPVSLLSAWGMIALSGVIINDAVVFLDKYNRNLKEGMQVYDAAYDAGISRFRPIVLTSLTTVLGLYPLLRETSFQAQFLIPMAISVAYGVLIGTFIILLFFPVVILYFNDVRFGAKWLWTGKKPTHESVERAIIDMDKEELFEEEDHEPILYGHHENTNGTKLTKEEVL